MVVMDAMRPEVSLLEWNVANVKDCGCDVYNTTKLG
ncbi:hypothetical protein C5S42_03690 [Candidatus Methanomarinus sp.]|nr:hypothetical protein C5S42_03690 [ANME-2 cluster archaeon]